MRRCKFLTNGGFKACIPLNFILEKEANRKGIAFYTMYNYKTHKTRVVGISYKKNENDNGMLFSYCPFCKADLIKERCKRNETKTQL